MRSSFLSNKSKRTKRKTKSFGDEELWWMSKLSLIMRGFSGVFIVVEAGPMVYSQKKLGKYR